MKLHLPAFEKTLRRNVRSAIKNSPELKREHRANKLRKHYSLTVLLRPIFSCIFAFLVGKIMHQTGHPATALAFINLWAFVLVFISAQR